MQKYPVEETYYEVELVFEVLLLKGYLFICPWAYPVRFCARTGPDRSGET